MKRQSIVGLVLLMFALSAAAFAREGKMKTMDVKQLVDHHFAAINERDAGKRAGLLREVYGENVRFIDPYFETAGIRELDRSYRDLQGKFPNLSFRVVGPIEAHHGRSRVHWELGPIGGKAVHSGDDFLRIEAGKIEEVFVVINGATGAP